MLDNKLNPIPCLFNWVLVFCAVPFSSSCFPALNSLLVLDFLPIFLSRFASASSPAVLYIKSHSIIKPSASPLTTNVGRGHEGGRANFEGNLGTSNLCFLDESGYPIIFVAGFYVSEQPRLPYVILI